MADGKLIMGPCDASPPRGGEACVTTESSLGTSKHHSLDQQKPIARKRSLLNPGVVIQTALRLLVQIGLRGAGGVCSAANSIFVARTLGPTFVGISGQANAFSQQGSILADLNQTSCLVREYINASDDGIRSQVFRANLLFRGLIVLAAFAVLGLIWLMGGVPPLYQQATVYSFAVFGLTAMQPAWIFQAIGRQTANVCLQAVTPLLILVCTWICLKPGVTPGTELRYVAVGNLIGFVLFWVIVYREARYLPIPSRDVRTAFRLIGMGRWLAIGGVASYIYTALEVPLVGLWIGPRDLGLYRTAVSIAFQMKVIGMLVQGLAYPTMVRHLNNKKAPARLWVKKAFGGGVAVAIVLSVPIYFVMPAVHSLLFGHEFSEASIITAILSYARIWGVIGMLGLATLCALGSSDRLVGIICVGTACLAMLLDVVIIPRFGILGAASVNLVSEMFCCGLVYFALCRAIRDHDHCL